MKNNSMIRKVPEHFVFIVILLFCSFIAQGRQPKLSFQKKYPDSSKTVTISTKTPTLKTLMAEIEGQSSFRFIYINSDVNDQQYLHLPCHRLSIGAAINLIKTSMNLTLSIQDYLIILRIDKVSAIEELQQQSLIPDFWAVVADKAGEPITGVNIKEAGSNNPRWISDTNGRFRYPYDVSGKLLELRHKKFETLQFLIRNVNGDSIIMKPLYEELEKFVVTAYTTTPWELNTASIYEISKDELQGSFGNNIASSLQSKVSGLLITDMNGISGNGPSIQLRGRQSIGLLPGPQNFVSNTPLILINGVPWAMPGKRLRSLGLDPTVNGVPEGVPLNGINLEDIESIIIYKDADATAIFGSRGANGVISITTRKGEPTTGISYTCTTERGLANSAFIPQYMNTGQYTEMIKEKLINAGLPVNQSNAPQLFKWPVDRYTNWPKYILGNIARVQQYHLSATGGIGKQFSFYSSAGFYEETSVLPAKLSNRTATFNVNGSFKPGKRSNTQFTLLISSVDNQQPAGDPMPYIRLAPNAPALRDANGKLVFEENGIKFGNIEGQQLNRYESKTLSAITSLNADYALSRRLFFKMRLGLNTVQVNEKAIYPIAANDPSNASTGAMETAYSTSQSLLFEPQLQYLDTSKPKRKTLSLFVGATIQDQTSSWNEIHRQGYKSDALLELQEAASTSERKGDDFSYRYAGFYGGANITLQKQYVFNVTGRYDGSNRFGPDHRFALFGAFGTAWIFTNAKWFKDSSGFLLFGKLRASIGTTGNDLCGNNGFKDSYRLITNGGSYADINPITPTGLSNPGLSWERNLKKEIAIELKSKCGISLTLSWYHNLTSRQLIAASLASQAGFSTLYGVNHEATVQNNGLELSLGMQKKFTRKIRWTSEFNLTIPHNKLRSFKNLESSIYNKSLIIGKSLTELQGLNVLKVNPNNGLYEFEVTDGGQAKLGPIGNLDPVIYGGLTSNLIIGKWALSIFVEGRQQKAFSPKMHAYSSLFNSTTGLLNNQDIFFLDRWQKEGDISSNQKFTTFRDPLYKISTSNALKSDMMLTDGSFIRLRYININWSPPLKWIKTIGLTDLKLYTRMQNLLTITGYEGGDPTIQTPTSVPSVRSYIAGIKATF